MKPKPKPHKPTLEDIVSSARGVGAKVTCSLEPNGRSKLHRQMHEFINNVCQYAEEPANWPLTQQEQIAFIRTVMFQARKIRNTQDYLAQACEIASEDLALAS